MSLAKISENSFNRHRRNKNNVHNNSKDLLSAIITLGNNVNGGESAFNGLTMNNLIKIAHVQVCGGCL